jgi:hypothetical protein
MPIVRANALSFIVTVGDHTRRARGNVWSSQRLRQPKVLLEITDDDGSVGGAAEVALLG